MNKLDSLFTPEILSGTWNRISDKIAVSELQRRTVIRSKQEPGLLLWCCTWKEEDGTLKVAFSEVTGNAANWPPSYQFNTPGVTVKRRIYASRDGGQSWQDTGIAAEGISPNWNLNCDAGSQNMVRLPDGRLLNSGRHYDSPETVDMTYPVYDPEKMDKPVTFPFTYRPVTTPLFHLAFFTSSDEGQTWQEISEIKSEHYAYATGLHRLRNGLIVATGGYAEGPLPDGYKGFITDSADNGKTWSPLQFFGINDEVVRGICEESDFVELEDGSLLLINRVVKSDGADILFHLKRDENGKWCVLSRSRPELFVKTGYPAMLRASDGTIFFDLMSMFLYTCDDGKTWEKLPMGATYYGKFLEAEPGKILNLTQNNAGDTPFPWWYDAGISQSSFRYRRYARFAQSDPAGGALQIGESAKEFHAAGVFAGESVCFVYGQNPQNGYFAGSETVPDSGDTFLLMGKMENGKKTVLRKFWTGKRSKNEPFELQLDRKGTLLQAAAKLNEGDWTDGHNPPAYLAMNLPEDHEGRVFVLISGTGEASDLRFAPAGGISIRENWQNPEESSSAIALDAGRTF